MKTEQWNINKLTPYGGNPRNNDGAVDAVARSIQQYGFRQPIVVDKDGVIIVGHTRLKAAVKLGLETVPVHVATDLTEAKAREYRIADNSTNEIAEWDHEMLAAELREMPEFDAAEFGVNMDGLGIFDAEEEPPPNLKSGDRAPFRQATFTLHDEQWEEVEAALAKAKADGGGESSVNENGNGNALAWICGRFNRG